MEDFNDIDAIGPYRTDEEAQDAFRHISENPLLEKISLYFFPEESGDYLKNIFLQLKSVDEFQLLVMAKVVRRILDRTAMTEFRISVPTRSSLHFQTTGTSFSIRPSPNTYCPETIFL